MLTRLLLCALLCVGSTACSGSEKTATAPVLRITAFNTVYTPSESQSGREPAWVVAMPNLTAPPRPPADLTTCAAVHSWLHRLGAVDVGGTTVAVEFWASRKEVQIDQVRIAARVLKRREPYEGEALACAPHDYLPDQGQLMYGNETLFDGQDVRTPRLDDMRPGDVVALPVKVPDVRLGLGDRAYVKVQVQALSGWYDWEMVVEAHADGVPATATLRDDTLPFTTNSGFRNGWTRSTSHVWCAGDRPQGVHVDCYGLSGQGIY